VQAQVDFFWPTSVLSEGASTTEDQDDGPAEEPVPPHGCKEPSPDKQVPGLTSFVEDSALGEDSTSETAALQLDDACAPGPDAPTSILGVSVAMDDSRWLPSKESDLPTTCPTSAAAFHPQPLEPMLEEEDIPSPASQAPACPAEEAAESIPALDERGEIVVPPALEEVQATVPEAMESVHPFDEAHDEVCLQNEGADQEDVAQVAPEEDGNEEQPTDAPVEAQEPPPCQPTVAEDASQQLAEAAQQAIAQVLFHNISRMESEESTSVVAAGTCQPKLHQAQEQGLRPQLEQPGCPQLSEDVPQQDAYPSTRQQAPVGPDRQLACAEQGAAATAPMPVTPVQVHSAMSALGMRGNLPRPKNRSAPSEGLLQAVALASEREMQTRAPLPAVEVLEALQERSIAPVKYPGNNTAAVSAPLPLPKPRRKTSSSSSADMPPLPAGTKPTAIQTVPADPPAPLPTAALRSGPDATLPRPLRQPKGTLPTALAETEPEQQGVALFPTADKGQADASEQVQEVQEDVARTRATGQRRLPRPVSVSDNGIEAEDAGLRSTGIPLHQLGAQQNR
jgi:hypothetical protein